MKRISTLPFTVVLIVTLLAAGASTPVTAHPSTSPSAIVAARLKHRPPKNWIRHYLGDDRYKIAGGVWKVVSTELDRYYYPAWAPEMLRQKPSLVIGFPSAAAAEEAGYLPSAYPMGESLFGLTPAEIEAARRRAAADSQLGTRITLSDGRSTVLLPKGWRHMRLGSQSQNTSAGAVSYKMDMLMPPGTETDSTANRAGIMFATLNMPGNSDISSLLSPARIEQLRTRLQQRAGADAGVAKALQGAQLGTGRLGGLSGLTIVPGKGANLPAGMGGRLTIVGRGSKMYIMAAQLPATDRNYGVVVNSFQPR